MGRNSYCLKMCVCIYLSECIVQSIFNYVFLFPVALGGCNNSERAFNKDKQKVQIRIKIIGLLSCKNKCTPNVALLAELSSQCNFLIICHGCSNDKESCSYQVFYFVPFVMKKCLHFRLVLIDKQPIYEARTCIIRKILRPKEYRILDI